MNAPNQLHSYAFDNADLEAADRHRYLSEILDPFTFERLSQIGDLTGKRCLELGAGGGSVARWLAERVGAAGAVVATDVNTRHLSPDAGYSVVEHDLTTEPVPAGPWDLIHARLVLAHLPKRHEILRDLVETLAPGGVLALEEWDGTAGNLVLAAPDTAAAEVLATFHAAVGEILRSHGCDQTWSRQMHGAMLEAELTDVDTVLHARSWPGGTAGALLLRVSLGQLEQELLASGLTKQQLSTVWELAGDPRLVWRGILTYATTGRRSPE